MRDLACARLPAFVDGELAGAEAERFRDHLAGCARCGAEMPRLLELAAALAPAAVPVRRAGWRYAIAAAVVAALVVWPRAREDVAVELPAARGFDVRVDAAYRPYRVARGAEDRGDPPFEQLARLARAGDWHGLATASLAYGDRAAARRYLARAWPTPAVIVDRAALDLLDGSEPALERALVALDGVLAVAPDHLAARWNLALAYVRLELPLSAVREFDRVAAAGEPGWSAEAIARAAALRAVFEPRRAAWEAADRVDPDWRADGPRGTQRRAFYDAVRAAPSRAAALALLPIAHRLDPDGVLARYVQRVATADFGARAGLAWAFRSVAQGMTKLDDAQVEQLAARMRAAGAPDLWLGLMLHTGAAGRHLDELARAAAGDPWLEAIAAHEAAKRAIAAGDRAGGERLLDRAAALAGGLAYRRLLIELDRSRLALALRRLPDAERIARDGLAAARVEGEWELERLFLDQLAETSRFRYAFARSRAYLGEELARAPDRCLVQRQVHQALANLAMLDLDPAGARRELIQTPRCGEPLSLLAALTWADVQRFGGRADEAQALRDGLAELRASGALGAGELALADHIEGRLVIERDRAAGQVLLRRAIARADGQPDDDHTKARGYSFSILALDAGRAGDFAAVLRLLGEERGVAPPARCAVGVAVEDERAIAVVRDARGAITGAYTAARTSPVVDSATLIPPALVQRLAGCAEVSVLARPPVLGAAHLLPGDLAWSYLVGGPRAGAPGPHLVVTGALPPPALGLPALHGDASDAGALVLAGRAATPGAVLAAMRTASVIEVHSHGFIDRGLSDASYLALTPDAAGRYALTAADVAASRLAGAPIVVLAACEAGAVAPFLDDGVGLPLAFARAGARAVLASPAAVDDATARAFFRGALARIAGGASPAIAVRDERAARPSDWAADVIVYQ